MIYFIGMFIQQIPIEDLLCAKHKCDRTSTREHRFLTEMGQWMYFEKAYLIYLLPCNRIYKVKPVKNLGWRTMESSIQ